LWSCCPRLLRFCTLSRPRASLRPAPTKRCVASLRAIGPLCASQQRPQLHRIDVRRSLVRGAYARMHTAVAPVFSTTTHVLMTRPSRFATAGRRFTTPSCVHDPAVCSPNRERSCSRRRRQRTVTHASSPERLAVAYTRGTASLCMLLRRPAGMLDTGVQFRLRFCQALRAALLKDCALVPHPAPPPGPTVPSAPATAYPLRALRAAPVTCPFATAPRTLRAFVEQDLRYQTLSIR